MTDATKPEGMEQEPGIATQTDDIELRTGNEADDADKADGEEKPKLKQSVEMKDIGPCKKHIKVTIDRADIDRLFNDKFSELVGDSYVAGFRPGKAPRKIVERRFQKDVSQQIKAEVLLQSLEQLAEENDVAPLAAPDINPSKIDIPKDGPLVYEFDVEVRPQFDLPNYKGLKIRRVQKTFTDEEVAEEERRILGPYGQLVPKDEPAAVGDYIITDLTTRDGDRELGSLKEIRVRIDPKLVLKDGVADQFGQTMAGVKAGEARVVDITLSDAAADETVRGKTVKATFDVKEVKSLRLPELTHEFLHEFGVHSPEQLRERIRVLLDRRHEYTQRQSARQQVLATFEAASSWDLPRDLLIRQARRALGRRIMEMQSAGMSDEEIRVRQRMLEQDVVRTTASSLKEHFVLQKIAEVEKIDVNEDDINDEIERMAIQNDESPRRVRARLEKEDLMEALAAELIERKALDLILDSAEYENVSAASQQSEEVAVSSVEEQAVKGEMHDPTEPPPSQPEAEETAAPKDE